MFLANERKKWFPRILSLFLAFLLVLGLFPARLAQADNSVQTGETTGRWTKGDTATYENVMRLTLTPALQAKLKQMYQGVSPGDWFEGSEGGINATFYSSEMSLEGNFALCANPFVHSTSTYCHRYQIAMQKLNAENLSEFMNAYRNVRFPQALQNEIAQTEGMDYVQFNLARASLYVYLMGILTKSVSTEVLEQLTAAYQAETGKSIALPTLRSPRNAVWISWYYSPDLYYARSLGVSHDVNAFISLSLGESMISFLSYLREKIEKGELMVENAQVNVYYNGGSLTRSSSQVIHSFTGQIRILPKVGKLSLSKISAKPEYTEGNSAYSLAGAEYDVYSNESLVDSAKVGTLVTDEKGQSNLLENLIEGTYYVKERKASKGYAVDSTVYTVQVTGGETALLAVKEIPQSDPVVVVLRKKDKTTGKPVGQGGATLSGAEFTFRFFPGEYAEGVNPAEQGAEPVRTWVMKTDEKGNVLLSEVYKVSGDVFYLDSSGNPSLPLGTITIQETKAPTGYLLDPSVFVRRITPEGTVEYVATYNEAEVENQPQSGTLVVDKFGELFDGWKKETVMLPVQKEGEIVEKEVEIPQKGVSLILERIYWEEGMKKQETESVLTDKNGTFSRMVPEGQYRILNAKGEVLAEETVEDAESKELKVTLPAIQKVEQERKDGIVENKDFSYSKATYREERLGGAKFALRAKEDVKSYDGKTVFFRKGDVLPIAQKEIVAEGKMLYPKGAVISVPALSKEILDNPELVAPYFVTETEEASTISRIPLGHYAMQEVEAPQGYRLDENVREFTFTPQESTVKADLQHSGKLINARQILSAKLQKEVLPTEYFGREGFENIVIGLFTKEEIEGLAKDSPVAVLAPDADGKLEAKDIPQGSYYWKEIAAKDGYVLSEKEIAVQADFDENPTTDKVITEKTPLENQPEVSKTVRIVKVNQETQKPLAGAGFRLYAVTKDGKKEVVKGKESVFYTDAKGEIAMEGLPVGSYVLVEVKAPEGFVKADTDYKIATSKDTHTELSIGNEPTMLIIRKYDNRTGTYLKGATLQLVEEDGTPVYLDENGHVTTKENGKLAEWVTTEKDYEFLVKGLTVGKSYRIVEKAAPKGYATADPVDFMLDNVSGVQLTNVANQPTIFEFSKIDKKTGKLLAGAHLRILDPKTGEVIADWVSEEKAHRVIGLSVGKAYQWAEVNAPEGYQIASPITFIVKDTGEIQKCIMEDEPIPPLTVAPPTGDRPLFPQYFCMLFAVVFLMIEKKKMKRKKIMHS
ncbi:MAG: SpaA isopeptide-forming pilin-related protein [Peptoniphilaceae bacterium]|nr:SpaA isopeptide-forming pilin-related protein [Peptoniphilaceae bacterium]MDY6147384.1 SpaA isopeptide-forming pilin-related protein [Peptoniphilaceae bacterium]